MNYVQWVGPCYSEHSQAHPTTRTSYHSKTWKKSRSFTRGFKFCSAQLQLPPWQVARSVQAITWLWHLLKGYNHELKTLQQCAKTNIIFSASTKILTPTRDTKVSLPKMESNQMDWHCTPSSKQLVMINKDVGFSVVVHVYQIKNKTTARESFSTAELKLFTYL
jgi:hypothetical protein